MKFWRYIPLLLIVTLLVGCGGGSKKDKTEVGVLFASYTKTDRQQALLSGLEKAGFLGVPMSAGQDHEQQMAQLSSAAEQNFSLVIIEPVQAENADQLAQILTDAQIPGIFIGEEPADAVLDSWDKLFYVGEEENRQGYLQGQILMDSMDGGDINGDGVITYAIVRGPESDPEAEQIARYCEAALKTSSGRLLDIQISGTKEKAKEDCRELLIKYGKDIEAFLCTSDSLALGAIQAVQACGWTPGQDVYILGVGDSEEILEQIYRGKCMGTVISDKSTLAQQVAKLAEALMENTEAEKRFYAGYLPVTKENVSIFREG